MRHQLLIDGFGWVNLAPQVAQQLRTRNRRTDRLRTVEENHE